MFFPLPSQDQEEIALVLTRNTTSDLQFYPIGMDWFRRVFSHLRWLEAGPEDVQSNWTENVGRVEDRRVEAGTHGNDFVLVGAEVWKLLSRIFGAPADACVPRGTQRVNGVWFVVVSEQQYVPISILSSFAFDTNRRDCSSGLVNLGNASYENATLQCLVHTQPIRDFCLTCNARGVGKMAAQLGALFEVMWTPKSNPVNVAVCPQRFRETLGYYAEQGTEQDDVQDFFPFLMGALQADCMGFVGDLGEPAHLKHKASAALDTFQLHNKTLVECGCKGLTTVSSEHCACLSVPIPDFPDRKVTYVPLDPARRPVKCRVNNLADRDGLVSAAFQALREANPPNLEDVAVCVFQAHRVVSWCDRLRRVDDLQDQGETWIFELQKEKALGIAGREELALEIAGLASKLENKRLDELENGVTERLNEGDQWREEMKKSMKLATVDFDDYNEVIEVCRELFEVIDDCHKALQHTEESSDVEVKEKLERIVSYCFKVSSRFDVACLEFFAHKLSQQITTTLMQEPVICIELQCRLDGFGANPLVMRIPASMTASQLRARLVERLSRSTKDRSDLFDFLGGVSLRYKELPLEENDIVASVVHNHGIVVADLADEIFEIVDIDDLKAWDDSIQRENKITIFDCIETLYEGGALEVSQEHNCGTCRDSMPRWRLVPPLPPYLAIHLKRFRSSTCAKIGEFVDFPLQGLDLSKYLLHCGDDEENPIYDCYAVCNHYENLDAGRYTAFSLNDDGVWYCYDDECVTRIASRNIVSPAAYVLYYRRRGALAH